MPGHPTPTTSLIRLVATSKMASQTAKFTLITQATTTTLLSKQTPATQSAPPLSFIAKTVTHYLFGDIPLPSFLQRYGDLLMGLTGDVAIATGLYIFLHRHKDDRGKIQLAVFHVLRILKDLPDLEDRIQRSQELLSTISEEVDRMVGVHLTRCEGAATLLKVKRKIQADLHARTQKGEAEKRRRVDGAALDDEDEALFDRPVEEHEEFAGSIPEAVVQAPSSSGERNGRTLQEQELPHEEGDLDLDMSMTDCSSQSTASQQSELGHPHDTGVPYDGDIEPVRQLSNSTSRRDQTSSFERADTPRPKTAKRKRYDLGPEDHDTYLSPTSWKSNPPVHEAPLTHTTNQDLGARAADSHVRSRPKTAVRPGTTISLHQPPSTIAVKTEGAVAGHWLASLREGLSPHVSPAVGTTQYRVAESRQLHGELQDERKQRRRFNAWVPKIWPIQQESDEEQTVGAVQQEERNELGRSGQSEGEEMVRQALDGQATADNTIQHAKQEDAAQSDKRETDLGRKLPDFPSSHTGSEDEDEGSIISSPPRPANPSPFHEHTEPPSPLPITPVPQASSLPAATPPPPASASASTSPHDPPAPGTSSLPKMVVRSAAPSPPESALPASKPLEEPQTHVEVEKPRRAGNVPRTPARSMAAGRVPGTRRSARVAQREKGGRK